MNNCGLFQIKINAICCKLKKKKKVPVLFSGKHGTIENK